MFSGLSKMIFGDRETAQFPSPHTDDCLLRTVKEEEDGDWVILGNADEPVENLEVDVTQLEGMVSDDSIALTPGLSTPPTPMEGSWTLAPPPCFVSTGATARTPEFSPLENLLIEHPSMSVYLPLETECRGERITPTKHKSTRTAKSFTLTSSNKAKTKRSPKRKDKSDSVTHRTGSDVARLHLAQLQAQKQVQSRTLESQKAEKQMSDSMIKQSTQVQSNSLYTIRHRANATKQSHTPSYRMGCKRKL